MSTTRHRVRDHDSPVADLAAEVARVAYPLATPQDLDPLLEAIGDARYVLLGEASHGTSEYYSWRAHLSRRLIEEKGFNFIAVEGDWPDCYHVNRYIKGYEDSGRSAREVLHTFTRWPTWMWANWEIVALTEWLREYNQDRPYGEQAGFYGLDVYSLHESMEAIMDYLRENRPEALEAARQVYLCFEPHGEDGQAYAWRTAMVPDNCEQEVVELLLEMRQQTSRFDSDPEDAFSAEQNAHTLVGAERYYRSMIGGQTSSWNVRDIHMADTLDRLMRHHGAGTRAIVWEHNTHIGDARATDMAAAGLVNVGQLVRERHEAEGVFLVGFGAYQGTVIAGREWGAPMEKMPVPPARSQSWEEILHQAGRHNQLLISEDLRAISAANDPRGHRAIGVVYNPERERGNYVPSVLPQRYDAFLFFEKSMALHPLHIEPQTDVPPETYPWGF